MPQVQGQDAPPGRIVLVTDASKGTASDGPMITLLEEMGDVTVINDDLGWIGPEVRRADLVAISDTVDPDRSFTALADLPVPIVTWSGEAVADLQMAATPGRPLGNQTSLAIVAPGDPLAAGRTGTVQVLGSSSSILVSEPGRNARIVAHAVAKPTLATLYRYEPGDLLVNRRPAPSCRIALFPTVASSPVLTTAGTNVVRAALSEALACGSRSLDADRDGVAPTLDCNDTDPSIGPMVADVPGDGIDQNCDGYDLPAGTRPVRNVVMIFADDMTYADYAYMPQTRALLSDEGVTFTGTHQNNPLCCPARATYLTGQRSANHGVMTNKPEEGGGYAALDHSNTVATWFADAGYDTTYIGKFLNSYGIDGIYPGVVDNLEIPPGWSRFQPIVGNPNFYGFTVNNHGTLVKPPGYQTDVLATMARASIRDSAGAGRPFLMFVSTPAPHTYGNALPPLPAPRHLGMFANLPVPRPPSYNEQDVKDKPPWVRRSPRLLPSAQAKLDRLWRSRLESLQAVDDLVAGVVEELAANGVLDETLLVFTSDNGFLLGEHRLTGKIRPYQESTHVPLVMRGGPFIGGANVDSLVSSIDIVPTILSVTGVTPDLVTDGADLSDVLVRPERYDNRALLIESAVGPGYGAVRTERWLWVEYFGTTRELYDNVNDPYQLTSLHDAPGEPAVVRSALSGLLGRLRSCVGAVECMAYSPVD